MIKIGLLSALGFLSIASHAKIGNFGVYSNAQDAKTSPSAILCHMSAIKAGSLKLGRGPLLVGDQSTSFTQVLSTGQQIPLKSDAFQSGLRGFTSYDGADVGNAIRARGPKGNFLVNIYIPSEPTKRNLEITDAFVRQLYAKQNLPTPVGLQTDSCIIFYEDLVELAATHPEIVIREK